MIETLLPLFGSLLDRVLPNAKDAAEAKLKLMDLAQQGELASLNADMQIALGQIEINKEEAKSDSLFKSGWRPAVGWICASGLLYSSIVQPILSWLSLNFELIPPPILDSGPLMTIIGGLLGFGGYRTYERVKGAIK